MELLDSGKFEEAGIEALNLRDASRIAAARFMERLPSSVRAPKLTIDGEGDIVLAWDSPRKVFVTVEGQVLHAILDPGTPDSMHIDSLNFADGDIPGEVLKILPKG
ncbi:hypothetical protein [Defluviimonas denitrificans]|uniref:hypothetical protein n=1 Tax=Albidovulum denitrificans TaxID=404881 RepID=UPI0011AFFF58|nr:hypothetical protein [Defluviimonas denitrificans]